MNRPTTKPLLYLVHGHEPYQKKMALNTLYEKMNTAGYLEKTTFEIHRNAQFQPLKNAASQKSLFAQKKCLEIRILEAQLNKKTAEDFIEFINSQPNTICFLIILDKTSKTTFQSAWFTQLQRSAARIIKAYPLALPALKTWIQNQLKIYKLSISPQCVQDLIEKTQGNLLLTAQTLEKAAILNHTHPISKNDFSELLYHNPQCSLFEFTDQLLEGDFNQTFQTFKTLISMGVEPILITWGIARAVRILLNLHFSKNAALNIWPAQRARYQKASLRLSESQLKYILLKLSDLDLQSKGVYKIPSQTTLLEEISQLILHFSMPQNSKELKRCPH